MSNAQWAVVPDIRHWHGDMRRNWSPYVLTGSMSYSGLNHAQWAAEKLRRRGVGCFVELIGENGMKV